MILRARKIINSNSLNLRSLIAYTTLTVCLSRNYSALSYVIEAAHRSFGTSQAPFLGLRFGQHSITYPHCRGGSLKMTASSIASKDVDAETSPVIPCSKLDALRSKMKELNLDAYIIPTDDPHLSEYVPETYMRRAFMTGFCGSAGTAIVTLEDAFLWTDSRYFNEASLSLDANHWQLMKQGLPKVPTIIKFFSKQAVEKYKKSKKRFRVGLDPFVHSASFAEDLNEAFDLASNEEGVEDFIGEIDCLEAEGNLIDSIWGNDRPAVPQSLFRVHPIEFSGKSVNHKIEKIRIEMKENKSTLSIFSALDDIAYLFNMRCSGDIATCPVGIAYASVSEGAATLFCDEAKVSSQAVQTHLKEADVTVKPYEDILAGIKNHLKDEEMAKVWIDKGRANYALCRLIPNSQMIGSQNAVTPMKALKNKTEMEGMRRAHIADGIAMAHFIAWLENAILNEGRKVSEVEVDEVLTNYRAKQNGFVEVSFPTIAGVGSNGAIIHYRAEEGSNLLKHLDATNPILIDSGGQYEYGTTDVTRTLHFGNPAPDFIDYYTRVLKGNIAVDQMRFPVDTPGFALDIFARKALWEVGKDYGHGTGHGVGAALNVHEGPQSISPRWGNKEGLKKGMIVSNEPGYYEDGNCGIRIENLLEVKYVNDDDNVAFDKGLKDGDDGYPEKAAGEKTFLKFSKLTMIPIQKNLIDTSLMTSSELDWLDSYHQEVFEKISPFLENGTPEMTWLKKACEKIDRPV